MTLRPTLCPCGHGPEQHYADDRGVRWACCARGCECGRYGSRTAVAPVRVEPHPAEPAPAPRYIPPPIGGYT